MTWDPNEGSALLVKVGRHGDHPSNGLCRRRAVRQTEIPTNAEPLCCGLSNFALLDLPDLESKGSGINS
jgi:hypothetical protein